jgi:hypothetical protein
MKTQQKLLIALLCLTFAAVGSIQALRPSVAHAEDKVKKSELSNTMGDIDDMMKKLRRSIRKPETNAQSLQLLADIEKAMVACKSMTPSKAATVPADQKDKFIAAYRKEMAGTIINLCELEQAILDGDNAKAVEIYKGITEREDKAHDQFKPKDEEK